MSASVLTVDFCGEMYTASDENQLIVGREGQIRIDDNQFLHRHFLSFSVGSGLWWVTNVGTRLTATVADTQGLMQAWLAPSAQLPLVFSETNIWFTAGPTTYELIVSVEPPTYAPPLQMFEPDGTTTVGRLSLTPDQQLLLLALAEPALRHGRRGDIPSSAAAAARLGWTQTKFNRKLDNVCEKLSQTGVRGLRGSSEQLASSRRARLVEYALASRMISRDLLSLLENPS